MLLTTGWCAMWLMVIGHYPHCEWVTFIMRLEMMKDSTFSLVGGTGSISAGSIGINILDIIFRFGLDLMPTRNAIVSVCMIARMVRLLRHRGMPI